MRTVAGALFAAVLAICLCRQLAEASCGNFQPGSMSLVELKSQYRGAIFHLKIDGQPSGTGFLIDSEHGYLLTASHVVAALNEKPKLTVESPALPGTSFGARIVKALPAHDLALVQLDNPTAVANLHAVDIALHVPNEDQQVYAMGYPDYGNEQGNDLVAQRVKVVTIHDGKIQVTQPGVAGGASGGPLLDASGDAIGACLERVGTGASVARYVPMIEAADLLDEIPMSNGIRSLDDQVRSNKITPAVLMQRMIKGPGNPSNLDLYAWSRQVMKHRHDYANSAALLKCPVLEALIDRGLADLVVDMTEFADDAQQATAYLKVARREAAFGSNYAAIKHARSAETEFAHANDKQGISEARIVMANSQLQLGLAWKAASTLQPVYQDVASLDQRQMAATYATAGQIYMQSGDLAKAKPEFDKAAQTYQAVGSFVNAANASFAKADINLRQGHYSAAGDDFNNAYNLYSQANDPAGQSASLYKLAIAKKESGKFDDFLETLKTYLHLIATGKYSSDAAKGLSDVEK